MLLDKTIKRFKKGIVITATGLATTGAIVGASKLSENETKNEGNKKTFVVEESPKMDYSISKKQAIDDFDKAFQKIQLAGLDYEDFFSPNKKLAEALSNPKKSERVKLMLAYLSTKGKSNNSLHGIGMGKPPRHLTSHSPTDMRKILKGIPKEKFNHPMSHPSNQGKMRGNRKKER